MEEKVRLDVELNAKGALENYAKIKIRVDELRLFLHKSARKLTVRPFCGPDGNNKGCNSKRNYSPYYVQ